MIDVDTYWRVSWRTLDPRKRWRATFTRHARRGDALTAGAAVARMGYEVRLWTMANDHQAAVEINGMGCF